MGGIGPNLPEPHLVPEYRSLHSTLGPAGDSERTLVSLLDQGGVDKCCDERSYNGANSTMLRSVWLRPSPIIRPGSRGTD